MHKNKQINRILTSIVASMVALSALSQDPGDRPRLVIGIVIDQLNSDCLDLLQSRFGEAGFKRLMREGAFLENVEFDVPDLDIASGTAMLMSGAYPSVNGIQCTYVYDRKHGKPQYILADPSSMGNFTDDAYSPAAYKVSTLADELRVHTSGMGYVHSLAADPQQAILLAGHAANSAFWINDITGNWASTTFYRTSPQILTGRNYRLPLATRLDTMSWVPSIPLDRYPDILSFKKYYPFRYIYSSSDRDRFRKFKKSALANNEVTTVAIEYLNTLKLGRRGQTDMLCLGYTAAPYMYSTDGDNRVENQDLYLRLDQELGRLFAEIDKNVGMSNTLVFVASTGYYYDNTRPAERFNIPTGEFYPERAISLLNMYLMAIYGNGQWVEGYFNRHFFLNHELIKEKKLSLDEVRAKSSELLRQMSGITAAYTFEEILNNPASAEARALHKSTVPAYCGDVVVEVSPGWLIMDRGNDNFDEAKLIRTNAVSTPVFIMGSTVKPQKITTPVEATAIAPTVASILRIRSPNAAQSTPLYLGY